MFCQESTHVMVWCLIKHRDTLPVSVMCYVHKRTCDLVEIVACVSLICCSEPFLDINVCLLLASGYRHLTFKLSVVLTYKGTA